MGTARKARLRTLGAVAALAGLLVCAAVAFADNVVDDVVGSTAATSIVSISNGGTSGNIGVKLNGGGNDGCDVTNGKATSLAVRITAPSGVDVLDSSGAALTNQTLNFTECGTFQYFKLRSSVAGDHSIGAELTPSGGTGTGRFENEMGFTLRVAAAQTQTPTLAAPTVSGALSDGTVGDNGWYTAAPTATWTLGGGTAASFTGHCLDPATSAFRASASVGSTDTATGSVTCSATNATGTGSRTLNYKLDGTRPTSDVAGFTAGTTYNRGDTLPTASCDGSDATSGIKVDGDGNEIGNGTLTAVSSLTVNGVGTASWYCNGAEDNAGNDQTTQSATRGYSVQYARDGGILQPINADGNSVFSQKRAVPVKFQLGQDPAGGFDVSSWTLRRENVQCGNEVTWVAESTVDTGTTSSNTGLRYDATADQYIANATLSGTTVGKCYRFVVGFDDGTTLESPKFKIGK